MKERPNLFSKWWKHKRKYSKRLSAKINRRNAKLKLDKER